MDKWDFGQRDGQQSEFVDKKSVEESTYSDEKKLIAGSAVKEGK
jgi:hypothetical protein